MTYVDLPDIQYTSEDVTEVQSNLITVYEGLTGRTLYQSDPVRLFLLSIATIIVQQRVLINRTAKGNLLRYAKGVLLDHMAPWTERLTASSALTTIQINLSIPLPGVQTIPAGTRIAPTGGDGSLYFYTADVLEIAAGMTTGTVDAVCSVAGDTGNGFLPGQLTVLMDPLPYVQSVTNLTTSSGGAEAETDDAFRERIRTAPESFSTAGPKDAYEYWAKTASAAIIDVHAYSPSDGNVTVVPLLTGGAIPGQDILDAVAEVLNDRTKRPMTDYLTVSAPEAVTYNTQLTYYIRRSRSAESLTIQAAVSEAVSAYQLWQRSKLGRDINPSELISRIMAAGAQRVSVTSPTYSDITETQVAKDDSTIVTYGGLVDD